MKLRSHFLVRNYLGSPDSPLSRATLALPETVTTAYSNRRLLRYIATPRGATTHNIFLSLPPSKPTKVHGEPPPVVAGKRSQSRDCSESFLAVDLPFSSQIDRRI